MTGVPATDPSEGQRQKPELVLRLFVYDDSLFARRAILEIEDLRRRHLGPDATVEVIDIEANPEIAEEERLLAVPALQLEAPGPRRRIIGDLSDHDKVLASLGLVSTEAP
jgi:circadian clock protein KaiB